MPKRSNSQWTWCASCSDVVVKPQPDTARLFAADVPSLSQIPNNRFTRSPQPMS